MKQFGGKVSLREIRRCLSVTEVLCVIPQVFINIRVNCVLATIWYCLATHYYSYLVAKVI